MNPASTMTMLQATANQLLATVAPSAYRLVRTQVLLEDEAETASTDGESQIIMPSTFCGEAIPENQAVSVGLLAHEVSHFLQPLAEVDRVQEAERIPHWLVNIAIDLQGESLIQSIFPSLREVLTETRRVVHQRQLAAYEADVAAATSLRDVVGPLALLCRFQSPQQIFDWHCGDRLAGKAFESTAQALMERLATAMTIPPSALPIFLTSLIRRFPQLRESQAPELPMGPPRSRHPHRHSSLLLDEIQANVGTWGGGDRVPIEVKRYVTQPPEPDAIRLARAIQSRFAAARSAVDVMAPGRFDRHEAVRGNLPFRMALPGPEQPAPRVVICVDVSSSMHGPKQSAATVASQALALAVKQAGGEVVGLLFDGSAAVDEQAGSQAIFSPRRQWRNSGGTDFLFLSEAWRRWPQHRILLLTDGCGAVPGVLPQDKARTAAIVIPDGDPATMREIAARVVELDDVTRLPSVMAMLVPRSRIA